MTKKNKTMDILAIIGFVTGGTLLGYKLGKRSKEKNNKEANNTQRDTQTETDSTRTCELPEIAFLREKDRLFPLLRGVSSSNITNKDEWKKIIEEINNEDLTAMWNNGSKNPNLWVIYLQSFGIQQDFLTEFVGIVEYNERYNVSNATQIEVGKTYQVLFPCWIYTDRNNIKQVALKGVVEIKK